MPWKLFGKCTPDLVIVLPKPSFGFGKEHKIKMPDKQKSVDYKTTAVEYFLVDDTTQDGVCRIFQ